MGMLFCRAASVMRRHRRNGLQPEAPGPPCSCPRPEQLSPPVPQPSLAACPCPRGGVGAEAALGLETSSWTRRRTRPPPGHVADFACRGRTPWHGPRRKSPGSHWALSRTLARTLGLQLSLRPGAATMRKFPGDSAQNTSREPRAGERTAPAPDSAAWKGSSKSWAPPRVASAPHLPPRVSTAGVCACARPGAPRGRSGKRAPLSRCPSVNAPALYSSP